MKCLRQLLAVSVRAIVLALFLLNAQTASAKSPPFYWEFINVLIDVQQNGDMLITETQKYVFTGLIGNERSRIIPLDKVDRIDQIEVFEGEERIPISTDIINNQQRITWQHAMNPPESRTFVLKYRVVGGIRVYKGVIQAYKGKDLIYFRAISGNRAAPVQSGKVTIRLPDFLAEEIGDSKSFGVPTDTKQLDGRTMEFLSKGPLSPDQELGVQVSFSQVYWDAINVSIDEQAMLIDVQKNGDMLVNESRKYVFRGIYSNERYRYISLETADRVDQVEVYEGDRKLPVKADVRDNQLAISWLHELDFPETHTFNLKYRIMGSLLFQEKEDVLLVTPISGKHPIPVQKSKVTIRLPDSFIGKIHTVKSSGMESWKSDERTVELVSQGAVKPRQAVNIQISLPHGALEVSMPEWQRKRAEYWKRKRGK
ncbi:MAG: DUF2207 domain-containing protein [Candidatus Electrothrix sp. Rat3]|nr:DUF2207 domain-containing protein [Candidatus Electrothrix rattekaaiensis]